MNTYILHEVDTRFYIINQVGIETTSYISQQMIKKVHDKNTSFTSTLVRTEEWNT